MSVFFLGSEMCTTLCASPGPPDAPLDVQLDLGPTPGIALISWLPVTIDAAGTSNGVRVTGYTIFADKNKVSGQELNWWESNVPILRASIRGNLLENETRVCFLHCWDLTRTYVSLVVLCIRTYPQWSLLSLDLYIGLLMQIFNQSIMWQQLNA